MARFAVLLVAFLGFLGVLPAAAQYPDRPVTVLEGYPPGGLVDVVTRTLVEAMKARFPKGLVVINKPGAAGSLAVAEITRSPADGYTIALSPHSALVIAPQMNDVGYKTPDEYEPFANVVAYYPMIAVRTESPYQTIQDLVADAKANPGKVRVGSPGEGTSSHLNLEELMHKTGTRMVHIPYKGWAESGPAVLGGHIEAVVAQPAELKGVVDGKRMRVLLAFHPQRHPVFPDAPTARELGWDVSNGVWYLMLAPKGTPAPVIKYLQDSVKAAVEDPKFVESMGSKGVDADYRPGDVLRADLWREYRLHTQILTRIGMIKK
jgi:tripartite-type tricarboxylate transporter receptor subunit TctC